MAEQEKCSKCGSAVERWLGVLMPIAEKDTTDELTQAKARIAELEAENKQVKAQRDELLNKSDDFDCGVASALDWGDDGFDGILFVEQIRGYRMAHEIERADNAKLQAIVDKLKADIVQIGVYASNTTAVVGEAAEAAKGNS